MFALIEQARKTEIQTDYDTSRVMAAVMNAFSKRTVKPLALMQTHNADEVRRKADEIRARQEIERVNAPPPTFDEILGGLRAAGFPVQDGRAAARVN